MANVSADQTRPRVPIKAVTKGEAITAQRENQIIAAVNDLRQGIGPGRQVPRAGAPSDPAGIEATTRIFFCS